MIAAEAQKLFDHSEQLFSPQEVEAAVDRIAKAITAEMADKNPVLLCVMSGAVPFAGALLTRLAFPLDFDYLHVSRYGDSTSGNKLTWRAAPFINVKDRTVLVVDDILDQGLTLAAIRSRMQTMGAKEVKIAVFADKANGKEKPVHADFVGLSVPDRFVFGFGMDIAGAWRNLPDVRAKID